MVSWVFGLGCFSALFTAPCLVTCPIRYQLIEYLGIEKRQETLCGSCMIAWCCDWCSGCQMMRDVRMTQLRMCMDTRDMRGSHHSHAPSIPLQPGQVAGVAGYEKKRDPETDSEFEGPYGETKEGGQQQSVMQMGMERYTGLPPGAKPTLGDMSGSSVEIQMEEYKQHEDQHQDPGRACL